MEALAGGAAALLSAAIWGYSSTLITRPAQIWGGQATNLFKSVIAAVLFLFAILVVLGPSALNVPSEALWRFAISGVLGLAIADTGYLSALKHIGPTLTAIVYETSGIFTCILGVALLDERLTAGEIGAVALVIGGVLLAVLDEPPAHVERRAPAARRALRALRRGLPRDRTRREQGGVRVARRGRRHDGFRGGDDRRLHAHDRGRDRPARPRSRDGVAPPADPRRSARRRDGARCFFAAVLGSFVAMVDHAVSLTLLKTGIASVLLVDDPHLHDSDRVEDAEPPAHLARGRGRGDRARRRVAAFTGSPF